MYTRYSLAELTAHLVSLLERRRVAFSEWNAETEAALEDEAKAALTEAHAGFVELADDALYWERTHRTLLTVALPRYFALAKAQHAFEHSAYGAWREGDLVSRIAYAAIGLFTGIIVVRTAIPDWLEPLPVALFLLGPLLPDLQAWRGKRRYAKGLAALVDDMAQEQSDAREYQPLGIAPVTDPETQTESDQTKPERHRT